MYGQTEATARMAYLPWKEADKKQGSIGIAIPGGYFWLEDAKGNIIQDSYKTGELIYWGKNVTMGYAVNRQSLTAGDERHGRLATGDEKRIGQFLSRKLKLFKKNFAVCKIDVIPRNSSGKILYEQLQKR